MATVTLTPVSTDGVLHSAGTFAPDNGNNTVYHGLNTALVARDNLWAQVEVIPSGTSIESADFDSWLPDYSGFIFKATVSGPGVVNVRFTLVHSAVR